ncbi:glycosyltransferase [Halostagnicola kamekurae]|uniref:Glycosyl transferase family 2 n=1 Tax=Halostagnicola kamekurae TaxID=619731 RepID=A0A1I6U5X9_9EURY|nr:glycosyltransferase [Halostagnicola kamekurae]SFS96880.1 Glycosyl transferase family 2 [Halostagnicola kamekurae]
MDDPHGKNPTNARDPSLGFVIPAYDPDVDILTTYIEDIRDTLSPSTVRVEIDAPTESTVGRLESVADEVNAADARRGKGKAIADGFDALSTDVLAFADADGSVPARSMETVVERIQNGTAAVSIGSRRHPDSRIVSHQTTGRRILGDAFAFVARKLLTTTCYDYQCGAKAVRADAWREIRERCQKEGFAWDLEFVSVAGSLGYDIAEVPVEWNDRPDSTVHPFWTTVELAVAVCSIRYRSQVDGRDATATNRQPTTASTVYYPENDER